ncbi:MAG: polysaccharide deacetylase family protein [bacterium]
MLSEKQDLIIPDSANKAPISFLSSGQIRYLADAGWEIGSHLVSHKSVIQLSDQDVRDELEQSKTQLEGISGKPVVTVAYPYGSYDERTLRMVREIGFHFGLTTDQPPLGNFPLLELPRNHVKGASWHHRFSFTRIFRHHGA